MSAGDSITAGLGARWSYLIRPTVFVVEDCGVSFATGGDEDIVSIAKLVEEKWGGRVEGKSYGSRRVNLCIDRPANRVFCPRDPIRLRRKDDGYNVAITGATSEALPLQLAELKRRLEEDSADLKDQSVLVTLLIGANDLCMWDCRRPEFQLESFRKHVNDFIDGIVSDTSANNLDILVAEVPALEGVPQRAKGTIMEPFAVLECPCAYKNGNIYNFTERIDKYNQILRDLKSSPQNPPRPRIIVTNALRREELKDWPGNMTSKLDAFHPSKHAHSYFARKLFTEMEGA